MGAIVQDTEINYHSAIESNTAENYEKTADYMKNAFQRKDSIEEKKSNLAAIASNEIGSGATNLEEISKEMDNDPEENMSIEEKDGNERSDTLLRSNDLDKSN